MSQEPAHGLDCVFWWESSGRYSNCGMWDGERKCFWWANAPEFTHDCTDADLVGWWAPVEELAALTAPAQPDTLIREAALEEAAQFVENNHLERFRDGTLNWHQRHDEISENGKITIRETAKAIRTLAAAPGKREGV